MKRGFLNQKNALERHDKKTTTVPNRPIRKTSIVSLSDAFAASAGQSDEYIQYRTLPRSDDPDGCSECIVTAIVERKILSTPGFPKPPPNFSTLGHRISESPGKGLGVFATQEFQIGDLSVICERPLLIYPIMLQVNAEEERLEYAVSNRMSPEKQAQFRALYNGHQNDGIGPILGVLVTNGFKLKGLQDELEAEAGIKGWYGGVFNTVSRINHSCTSNLQRHWDTASLSLQLRAARKISMEEELSLEYCDIMQPVAGRQKALTHFGFRCTCSSCLNPAISDLRRKKLREFDIATYSNDFQVWYQNLSLPDDYIIKPVLALLRMIEDEGLESIGATLHPVLALTGAYVALGDEVNVVKYGELLGRLTLAVEAVEGHDYNMRHNSLSHHKMDPMWMARKRMQRGEWKN